MVVKSITIFYFLEPPYFFSKFYPTNLLNKKFQIYFQRVIKKKFFSIP